MQRGRVERCLVAVAAAALLAGCASASAPSPPTGVDGLVIPTPSPDPDDFVASIDNEWLPLEVGAEWEYAVTERRGDRTREGVRAVLAEEGREIAGVATTAVVTRTTWGRRTAPEVVDHYAQDDEGNVWWFGRDGVWEAGEDGAEAGLAMPADPRLGDGFRLALDPGRFDVRARVAAVDAETVVPSGGYDDLVALEVRSPLDGRPELRYYAAGTGLVATEGPAGRLGLVAHDEPAS